MSHLEVLAEISGRGLSITAAGTDLRLAGPRERMDATLIGLIKAHKAELIEHLAAPEGCGLTELQRSYLVGRGEHVELGNVASHVYHEIEGCWDVARLERALQSVVARHGMLRTRFTAGGRQVEEPAAEVRIGRLDLRGEPADAQRARLAELRAQRSHRILPADRAPLLAADVTVLAPDRMVLHVSHDGLIMDAVSIFLFFRAWQSAYAGDESGAAAADGFSFADYVAATERARDRAPARRSRQYWLDRLDDLAPHPDLPLRTSPASIARPRFEQLFARLDAPAWARLKGRARAAGITPSALLLAAYAETLACWGAGRRFTVNVTVASRPPGHPGIGSAIGNFSDTMLAQVSIDRAVSFADRARALQAQLRRELDHRHYSGIEVLRELGRRRGSAAARMPYTFNSALGHAGDDIDGSALDLLGREVYVCSQTPQVWLDVSPFEQHGGLVVEFDYVAELFPDGLIEGLASGFGRLLAVLDGDGGWSAKTFDLLPADQRRRRAAANDTAAPLPPPGLLADAFLGHAGRAPAAPAIVTSGGTLSYGQLHRWAAEGAEWLRARGAGPDELVGLVMSRGPAQVAGIMAVILAGAAYLPIDAGLPAQRRDYMLADGNVRLALTNTDWQDTSGGVRDVLALGAPPGPGGPPAARPDGGWPVPGPGDLAYVLYTSGTTGSPKGVMVTRQAVANIVADCNARFAVGPRDRLFAISAFSFDLSVYDVLGALSAGAAIVMPDPGQAADPGHWLAMCASGGVTVWNSVPAIVALLHEAAAEQPAGALDTLRLVMMSGDRIPPALPAALRAARPGLEVVSLGGPTETTIWNISHPVASSEDGSRSIPYGRPTANNRAYVLDADGCDLPDWVTGEICAAGAGLARGYWGDPARTAERFRDDAGRGERLFRTGDLGRYLPDGEIDILGRGDFQIKVNGYRIEASEVETRLAELGAVDRAVVVRQEGARGGRLAAHLVPAGPARPADAELRAALRRQLPDYMIPSAIYWHDALPLTGNGKVDRARLAAETGAAEAGAAEAGAAAPAQAPEAPQTAEEHQVAALWARVLRVPSVPPATSLFDLGGDSLAAARILAGLRKQFGVSLTLDRLPEVETVRAMAAHVSAARGAAGAR